MHSELTLVQGERKDLLLLFHKWIFINTSKGPLCSPPKTLILLLKTRKLYLYRFVPGFFITFCWISIYFVPVPSCFHHYSLKLDITIPPVLVFALRVDLAIFVLPYEFYVFFPYFCEECHWSIDLKLHPNGVSYLVVWPLFTTFLLPIHKHGRLFHILVSLLFLHLVSHGFHCRGLSSLHLG